MSEEKNTSDEGNALRAASHEQETGDWSENTEDRRQNTELEKATKPETSNPPIAHNPQPITQNMEVHKHPHHVTHKKKWGEYFLEFLMIFLAVTLGFFAETIRENSTEHKRAREYATAMLKDLQNDTVQLRSYRTYFTTAANNIDTLMRLLVSAEPKDIPSGKLYWYGLWGGAHLYFVPNDATFQQMKSSGSLRYFGKSVAADVAKYDQFCRQIQLAEERQEGVYIEVRKARAQIFDFKYNDIGNDLAQAVQLYGDYSKVEPFMKSNPPLLSHDKTLFNEYVELVRSRFIRRSNIRNADSLLKVASVLIAELKKEYHLE